MLNSKSFLAIDFGAGSLKVAEFEQNEAGGLCLKRYGIKPLGIEGSQESSREATILKALQEALTEKGFGTKQINVCAPGFHVFSKFVKLPPVDTSKVTQIIHYEAQQNVPFPLEEVVWDYQILGTSASNELEVLLVAIKSEVVEGLFRTAEGAGLHLKLVDVSPAALCNAFRYNYGDLDGCTMLLDIGAKTSNVLFFEKGKVYSRSISIGANSITQDFANEAKLRFPEAEAIKIEKGFVSLGGAYEEPEDPQAAAISKIARQVMTRLHLQVNQTVQFYRSQQGGSAPVRVFLSGGASIMPYTAQFFAEKLNVPVDYFNPFRNIEIAPDLDLEELSKYAHSFGEVVGLGLRDLAHCPVELNLMPKSSRQRQELNQKKPYFVAAIFSIVLIVAAIGWAESRIASVRRHLVDDVKAKAAPLAKIDSDMTKANADRDALKKQVEDLTAQAEVRTYWANVLIDLRRALLQAETKTKEKVKAKDNTDVEVGVWVDAFAPILPPQSPFTAVGQSIGQFIDLSTLEGVPSAAPMAAAAAGEPVSRRGRGRGTTTAAVPAAAQVATVVASGDTTYVTLLCRAVKISPTADAELAYAVKQEIAACNWATNPIVLGDLGKDETSSTFTFPISVKLKKPFKL